MNGVGGWVPQKSGKSASRVEANGWKEQKHDRTMKTEGIRPQTGDRLRRGKEGKCKIPDKLRCMSRSEEGRGVKGGQRQRQWGGAKQTSRMAEPSLSGKAQLGGVCG